MCGLKLTLRYLNRTRRKKKEKGKNISLVTFQLRWLGILLNNKKAIFFFLLLNLFTGFLNYYNEGN